MPVLSFTIRVLTSLGLSEETREEKKINKKSFTNSFTSQNFSLIKFWKSSLTLFFLFDFSLLVRRNGGGVHSLRRTVLRAIVTESMDERTVSRRGIFGQSLMPKFIWPSGDPVVTK